MSKPAAASAAPAAEVDLSSLVVPSKLLALNLAGDNAALLPALLGAGLAPASPALSDCDSQLILTVHFSQPVRLSGVALLAAAADAAGGGGGGGGAPPTLLKVFLDRTSFSFEDVETSRAAAEVAPIAARDARAGRLLALPRAHSMPACRSATLFIDAEGADAVALLRVTLFGRPADDASMDFSKLQAG
jgi:hypothetical protein